MTDWSFIPCGFLSAVADVNLSESGEVEALAEAQSGGLPTAEGTVIQESTFRISCTKCTENINEHTTLHMAMFLLRKISIYSHLLGTQMQQARTYNTALSNHIC